MRIALDIRYRTGSGASSYIHNLLPHLLKHNHQYEFILIRFEHQVPAGWDECESIICSDWGPICQVGYDQLILPAVLKFHGIDLYHSLKLLGPRFSHCPQIKVAHSITSAFRGEFPGSRLQNLYWIVLGNHLFRSSTRIIAVSQFVKEFLMEILHIPESRIDVIYNGRDPHFRVVNDQHLLSEGPKIDAPFFLMVGNIFPVKNQLTVVKAFRDIAEQFPDHHLIMAGATAHSYFQDVKQLVQEFGLEKRIHFLGVVDKHTLVHLYNRAELLLMPSLTEGCPVTLLEAMGCGLPVIGSGRGGIPEVGKGAINIVEDPFDFEEWARAISILMNNPEQKAAMRQASLNRACHFDWEGAAIQHLAMYDAILEDFKSPFALLQK
jgi:glycosyltransferase involved in cell wall biosynthesis